MDIHETKQGDVLVLEPVGRLDSDTSRDFENKVSEKLAAGESLFVVDFGNIEYVSSAGLRVVLMLAKKLAAKGGKAIICTVNTGVQEIFDIVGFTRLLSFAATREEAIEELSS